MKPRIQIQSFGAQPICQKEILRYAGCREADPQTAELLESSLKEAEKALVYKVCFCELPVVIEGDECDFEIFSVRSRDLAKNLANCRRAVVFCATVGIELDRLIAKYSRRSPASALMLQAIGTQQIEALCDAFCKTVAKKEGCDTRPRFSCGYGDLPLGLQKELFSLLQCEKNIGVYLNDSLLMTPSKSVTAFVGLDDLL